MAKDGEAKEIAAAVMAAVVEIFQIVEATGDIFNCYFYSHDCSRQQMWNGMPMNNGMRMPLGGMNNMGSRMPMGGMPMQQNPRMQGQVSPPSFLPIVTFSSLGR